MSNPENFYTLAIASIAHTVGRAWWGSELPAINTTIYQHAERLAAGAEPATGSKTPTALRSIFDRLRENTGQAHYFPSKALDLDAATLYPKPLAELANSFQPLQQAFAQAIQTLQHQPNEQAKLETLLDHLQRYAWCAPAPQYGDDSDVSLYDHARITAALTVCLAAGPASEAGVAALIGGDLSGVQDWLYTLGSSKAAKALRGRSFYLQMLTEVIAYKLLDELGLPLTNLIYAGGGNFYILAPIPSVPEFERLSKEISQTLIDVHEGELFLAMGHTLIQEPEFSAGKIGAAWNRVNQALGRQKRQRFAGLGEAKMAELIGVALNQGGKPDKVCSICQRENPLGKPWPADPDNPAQTRCDLCSGLEALGNLLPKATHIIINRLSGSEPAPRMGGDWQAALRALGYQVEPVEADTAQGNLPKGVIFGRLGRIQPQPNPQQDGQVSFAYHSIPYVFFYRPLVNIVPFNKGEIATFDELTRAANGLDQWGVLRMDVDDLGALFRDGFGARATLSRTTQLSFALRLFFEGRLNEIGKRFNLATYSEQDHDRPGAKKGKDRVYAMYSGGDDLFIVGSWDALPHLAHEVRQEFSQFVAGNSGIGLSGGISLASERFPLYQAARQAGSAEARAKVFKRKQSGREKDALSFLGQVLGWEEFDAIWGRVSELHTWSATRRINRSVIQTLRSIDSEYRTGLKHLHKMRHSHSHGAPAGRFYYGPWIWHLIYQLSRVAERAKHAGHDDISVWIKTLRDELVKPEGPITTLGLTARWAEYLTREKSK